MTSTNPKLDEELLSASRTLVGDELRSLTYFSAANHRMIYLRDDLEYDENVEDIARYERTGFVSQGAYRDPELGEYQATVRIFENGYLTRVIVDDHGAFITTDEMKIERFGELAEAVSEILEDYR